MIMLWKIRILFGIINIIYATAHRILLYFSKKPSSIPPITNSLYMLSASTLARKIRQGEITSCEVVQAYITRIKEVNPFLNAVVEDRFSAAIIEAKNCDEQLKAGKFDVAILEKEKPLYGVPLTVKECCAVKGCSHSGCTLPRKGMKADYDATVIELLRNAGAIPLCVTNIPELSCGIESTNLLIGRTCNPYDTRYSVGGSSGGEGALLGAGASVIGLGSDMAGSIRLPAFLNGVFGHKPTAEIVPIKGHMPYSEDKLFRYFTTFGPMTRYAEDLVLLMKVITSKCNHDLRLDVPVDLRQVRVYYRLGLNESFGILPIPPEIKECILKAANHFTRFDVHAEKLPIDWPEIITEIALTGFLNIKKPPQLLIDVNNPKHQKNAQIEMLKAFFGLSQHTKQLLFFDISLETHFPFTESEILHYTEKGKEIRQKLLDLLGDNGVFIYPTFRNQILPNLTLCELLSVSSCGIVNIFGFPAVNVPMGLNHDGMPMGIQVIAAPYQDRLCLAVAKELETAFGGWVPPSVSIRD